MPSQMSLSHCQSTVTTSHIRRASSLICSRIASVCLPKRPQGEGTESQALGSYHSHACSFAQAIKALAMLQLCQVPAMFCPQHLCESLQLTLCINCAAGWPRWSAFLLPFQPDYKISCGRLQCLSSFWQAQCVDESLSCWT